MWHINQILPRICVTLNVNRNLSSSKILAAKPSYFKGEGKAPLVEWTVGQCVDNAAQKFATKTSLVVCHQNISKTFAELKDEVDQLGSSFIALGLKKGDRIGIWSLNCYQWILTQLAAAKAGLILVCLNPGYRPSDVHYCLNKTSAVALVADEGVKEVKYYDILSALLPTLQSSQKGQVNDKNIPGLKTIIMMSENDNKGTYKFSEVFKLGGENEKQKLREVEKTVQCTDPVKIMFTSGTTGNAKAAVLTHYGIVNNSYSAGKRVDLDLGNHVLCLPLPLFHAFGSCAGSLLSVVHGIKIIYPSRMSNAAAIVKAINQYKANSLFGTPTTYYDIINYIRQEKKNISLDVGLVGAATCPKHLFHDIEKMLKIKTLLNGYGATETSPGVFLPYLTDSLEIRSKYVGPAIDHIEVKVVNRNGKTVECGSPGELWVRGNCVMQGYWNNEDATKSVITEDKWFKTGDLAILNENGYASMVGRLQEMIIRGGENVYPSEVEKHLLNHLKIAEAHVVGVPDKRMGEELCACIKTAEGQNITEYEVKKYCSDTLAHHNVPKYVVFIDSAPRTFTGKVKKFELRDEILKELNLE